MGESNLYVSGEVLGRGGRLMRDSHREAADFGNP